MVHRRLWMILLTAALVGCARVSSVAPTSTPVTVASEMQVAGGSRPSGDTVVASGKIIPAQEAQLSFTVSGRVQEVRVVAGDSVQKGEPLAALETTLLDTDVAQAEGRLAAAQAELALLKANLRPGQIAAARARLEGAEATLAQAEAQRDQLVSGTTKAEVAASQAKLAAAQAEEMAERTAYDQSQGHDVKDWEEKVAIFRLRAAEQDRVAAEAQLTQTEHGARTQVRAAEAAVQTASAQRDVAQAQLDLLQEGPTAEQVAAAEATVHRAEGALQAARAVLDQTTLRAPFGGSVTVLEVNSGEVVMPGQVLVQLADLDHLRVQTTDLSERDVPRVATGQRVVVHVEALGAEFGGQVVDIATQANTIGGDVVYAVTIGLDEQPPGLRWGMSVDAEIEVR